MKQHLFKLLILFGLLSIGTSCSEETVMEDYVLDRGYKYIPLEVGKYKIYQVDSTKFKIETSTVNVTKSTTFVKEEIVKTTIDNAGDTIHILERFTRNAPSESWKIADVWSIKKTINRLERTEENVKLITMVFPLKQGDSFDATQYIDRNVALTIEGETITPFSFSWNSEVKSIGQQATIHNQNYTVAKVQLVDDESSIGRRYADRTYAEGVGLVHRVDSLLTTQTFYPDGTPWSERAEKGYILEQTLLEHN